MPKRKMKKEKKELIALQSFRCFSGQDLKLFDNSHLMQPCLTPWWEEISTAELILQFGETEALFKKTGLSLLSVLHFKRKRVAHVDLRPCKCLWLRRPIRHISTVNTLFKVSVSVASMSSPQDWKHTGC